MIKWLSNICIGFHSRSREQTIQCICTYQVGLIAHTHLCRDNDELLLGHQCLSKSPNIGPLACRDIFQILTIRPHFDGTFLFYTFHYCMYLKNDQHTLYYYITNLFKPRCDFFFLLPFHPNCMHNILIIRVH